MDRRNFIKNTTMSGLVLGLGISSVSCEDVQKKEFPPIDKEKLNLGLAETLELIKEINSRLAATLPYEDLGLLELFSDGESRIEEALQNIDNLPTILLEKMKKEKEAVMKVVSSPEYLHRLADDHFEDPASEQKRRIQILENASIEYNYKYIASNTARTDGAVEIEYSLPQCVLVDGVFAHEFTHLVGKEKEIKRFIEDFEASNDGGGVFVDILSADGLFSKLNKVTEDRIDYKRFVSSYLDPREIYARRTVFILFLEENNIMQYGETFTKDTYRKAINTLEKEHQQKKSDIIGNEVYILLKILSEDGVIKIMNKYAANNIKDLDFYTLVQATKNLSINRVT